MVAVQWYVGELICLPRGQRKTSLKRRPLTNRLLYKYNNLGGRFIPMEHTTCIHVDALVKFSDQRRRTT